MPLTLIVPGFLVLVLLAPSAGADTAQVKVTQRHLVPLCLNGAPVKAGTREWKLEAGTHSMAFTMRNEPRPGFVGDGNTASAVAAISFTAEPGHSYEVEVRAEAVSFSTRVWTRGEWRPVVRDRTLDRIVSGEAEWRDAAGSCEPEP